MENYNNQKENLNSNIFIGKKITRNFQKGKKEIYIFGKLFH